MAWTLEPPFLDLPFPQDKCTTVWARALASSSYQVSSHQSPACNCCWSCSMQRGLTVGWRLFHSFGVRNSNPWWNNNDNNLRNQFSSRGRRDTEVCRRIDAATKLTSAAPSAIITPFKYSPITVRMAIWRWEPRIICRCAYYHPANSNS